MKERPILFSAPMVRALLAGTKTQTRRIAKPVRHPDWGNLYSPGALVREHEPMHVIYRACPYGQPGDRLWVRETWAAPHSEDARPPRAIQCDWMQIHYAATEERGGLLWRPSIHMPRWASRITLEITGVRVERLHDISESDAIAEGIVECAIPADDEGPRRIGYMVGPDDGESGLSVSPIEPYRNLWESINGASSWDVNPWVWAIEFRRVEGTAS